MTSMTDSEFWQNLPYRRKLRRRGIPMIESTFPYRARPHKNSAPTGYPAAWQGDIEGVKHAVDCHGAQLLSATMIVTTGGRLHSSTERVSERLSSDGDLADENDKGSLEDKQQISNELQISTKVSVILPELESLNLDLGEKPTEDMARSWWSRRLPPLLRARRRTDPCKSANPPRGAEHSICPCSRCCSPSSSLQSTEAMLFSKPAEHREIDRFCEMLRGIDLTSWFRQHRCSWSEPSESLPLTAETLSQLRVRDVNLEIERTQIVNELAMTQDFLRYIIDAISRSQPPIRVNMIREYKRLKDQETSLVEHLQDIEHEMDHINELENPRNCEFADFSHESILPIKPPPHQNDPRLEVPWKNPPEKCGIITPSQVAHLTNANCQLQRYNEDWTTAQKSMNSQTSPLYIPWPTNSFNPPKKCHNSNQAPEDQSNAEQAWKLAAYQFFCSPFGLRTLICDNQDSGKNLDLVIAAKDPREEVVVRLRKLKGQLKPGEDSVA